MGKWADRWINPERWAKRKPVNYDTSNRIIGLENDVKSLGKAFVKIDNDIYQMKIEKFDEGLKKALEVPKPDPRIKLILDYLNLEYVPETIEPAKLIKKAKAKR